MNEIKGIEELKQKSLGIQDKAREIDINDEISLETASEFLIILKQGRKEVDKAFDPIIAKNHEAHKLAIATKKKYSDPWIAAELIVKPQISNYMAELARKQREAEEAARKAEEERRQKLETAFKADEAGDAEKAEDILKDVTPEVTKAEYIPQPKLTGTSIRKIWKWEVIDLNLVPRVYLQVDSSKIGAAVRSAKGETHISGIRVYSEDSVAIRTK